VIKMRDIVKILSQRVSELFSKRIEIGKRNYSDKNTIYIEISGGKFTYGRMTINGNIIVILDYDDYTDIVNVASGFNSLIRRIDNSIRRNGDFIEARGFAIMDVVIAGAMLKILNIEFEAGEVI